MTTVVSGRRFAVANQEKQVPSLCSGQALRLRLAQPAPNFAQDDIVG